MESKEARIADLKKQILEIENEVSMNYELVEVTPDCGAGISDDHKSVALSYDLDQLVDYCEDTYEYTPKFERDRKDGKKPCEKWYFLRYTKTQIVG